MCMRKEKRRRKENKSTFSLSIFSTVRRINGTLAESVVYIRTAKGFHL